MTEKLSEYERRRLENIRSNQKILESLSIPMLPIETPASEPKRSAPATKKNRTQLKVDEPTAKRTSTRLQDRASGKTAQMSIADELALYRGNLYTEAKPEKVRPKRILGNIPFEPDNGATEDFITLMSSLVTKNECKASHQSSGSRRYQIDGEFSIAKLVQERIYSMAVHPDPQKIIVSAGGKEGGLGIWDATAVMQGNANTRTTYHFKPHSGSISNQLYHPNNPGQLLMTSYDGIIRCLDIVKGEFSKVYRAEDEQYISGFDTSSDGSILYFTDMDGVLTRIDTRSKSKTSTFQLHEKKAGGLSISPVDPNYLATSSNDGSVCVWDMRTIKPFESDMVVRFEYKRAVTSVFFHPYMREALVSTCYDDSVRIHQDFISGGNPTELRIVHNNQTGRWITPFRAKWDPKSTDELHSHVVVGDMNRGLDLIDMHTGIITNNTSELLTAQPAVNATHPTLDIIVSGTASGKAILWKSA